MTDAEYEAAERQNQVERDLARFYARNPQASPAATITGEPVGRSPLDMGTVPWEEVGKSVEFPDVTDMDFQHEVMPILRKRLVWDIVPKTAQVKSFGARMGVTPGSEEGDIVESVDSDARRALLLPLMPMVHLAAAEAGLTVSRAKMLADEDTPEADGSVMVLSPEHDVIAEVAGGTLAVIANLLELGILTYGKAVTGE